MSHIILLHLAAILALTTTLTLANPKHRSALFHRSLRHRPAPTFPFDFASQPPWATDNFVCSCANASWCKPLSTQKAAKELFVYSPNEEMYATSYDWSHVTTMVTYSMPHPEMVCYAHQRGVRVVWAFGTDWTVAMDPEKRSAYATSIASTVATYGLDGINMDFENPPPDPLHTSYVTALLFAIVDAVKAGNPHAQVSVCFASFSASGYTYYPFDFAALLRVSDFLLAMMYDMSTRSVAPNSFAPAINYTFSGLYELASMHPDKLVLAFPWYGYEYRCVNGTVSDVNCLVASAGEVCYEGIMQILQKTSSRYTNISSVTTNVSPTTGTYATFSAVDTTDKATPHHIFVYDNPQSLKVKYDLSMRQGARGLSVFQAACLGNSTVPPMPSLRQAMWDAINSYFPANK